MAPPAPASRLLPPLVLALAGMSRATFTVTAWPRVAVVAFGGSVWLNCSHSGCPGGDNDSATLELDTALDVTAGPWGHRWRSFVLANVSLWHPGSVTCAGRCGDSEDRDSASVIVYQPPQRVSLDPLPPVAVGDSRNVTCHVQGVAPVRNLTVTLRRGAETLSTRSFGDTAGDSDSDSDGSASVAVSHLLSVTRGDHGQDVTCHAELSLRPHGPLFARAAVPVTLAVFALPEPPQLSVPATLEAGTVTEATCHIRGAFPPGDVAVAVALDREPLDVAVRVAGDAVTATARLSPLSPGRRELRCSARVAQVTRTARSDIRVYAFPPPRLALSPAVARAGSEVTVTCHCGGTEPPAVRLQLRSDHGAVLAQWPERWPERWPEWPQEWPEWPERWPEWPERWPEWPEPRLDIALLARPSDDRRRFWCRATLDLGDSAVTKEAVAQLEVQYLPELPASGCPGTRTWLQGTLEALSCRATGNPVPTVRCGHRGVTEATAEPRPVTRDRAGTYVCNATNALGTRSRRVTVRVEYEPSLSEARCPARRVWLEGQRWHLGCDADGDPAPRTRCHRHGGAGGGDTDEGDTDGGTDGHGHPRVVTRADGGRYVCRATNRHGVAERSVLVTVEYRPSLGERGCPERRRWLEGTRAELRCQASGNPRPRVTCHRLRDTGDTPEATGLGDIPGDTGPSDNRDIADVTGLGDSGDIPEAAEPGDSRDITDVTESRDNSDITDVTDSVPEATGPGDSGGIPGDTGLGDNRDITDVTEPGDIPGATEPGDSRDITDVTQSGDSRDTPEATEPGGNRDILGVTEPGDIPGATEPGDNRDIPDVTELGDSRDILGVTGSGDNSHAPSVTEPGDNRDIPRATKLGDNRHPHDVTEPGDNSNVTEPGDNRDTSNVTEPGDNSNVTEPGDNRDASNVTEPGDNRDTLHVTEPGDNRDASNVTEPGDNRDTSDVTANVTRGHAGTYRCRATNAHGWAERNVTVTVEYVPAGVTVRVLPSATVPRGGAFTVTCGAQGLPAPTLTWALPPAPNLRLAGDNGSVTVTAATAANRGRYTCTATNRHGHRAASVEVSVDESWLVALVALGALGAVTLVALAVAGGCHLRSTACKKGEYNVRDAEGSAQATNRDRDGDRDGDRDTRWHRDREQRDWERDHRDRHRREHWDNRGDIFGIQLSQP